MTSAAPYTITFTPAARRRLSKLPLSAAAALYEHLTGPVAGNPHRLGKPLEAPFEDVLSTRGGDYRVLYTIDDRADRHGLGGRPPARRLPPKMTAVLVKTTSAQSPVVAGAALLSAVIPGRRLDKGRPERGDTRVIIAAFSSWRLSNDHPCIRRYASEEFGDLRSLVPRARRRGRDRCVGRSV
jgi:mRNA interferase RelE/StbE